MEKKNPNIYQRALDIVNNRINPDIPQGGGESAPEVENAIETHGMGWTDTEEVEGFDIQWDGNTEGLETFLFMEGFNPTYKVSDKIVTSIESLIGSKFTLSAGAGSHDYEMPTNNGVKTLTNFGDSIKEMLPSFPDIFAFGLDVEHDAPLGYILPVDTDVDEEDFDIHIHASAGIYFAKFDLGGTQYVISHLYKESSTEEVVHQIDQKYIPGGEFTVVIDYNSIGSDTQAAYDEALAAFQAKKNVLLKKGDVYIPMTGYDSEHCFFGGTASAYLPGNIINAVYAHIGPNGNKFWWGYTIPLGANALSISDEDEHFTGTNVESALAELASRLDALESK